MTTKEDQDQSCATGSVLPLLVARTPGMRIMIRSGSEPDAPDVYVRLLGALAKEVVK